MLTVINCNLGTNYTEEIAQNDINEQLAQRLEQDSNFKRTVANNIERNSINRSSNGLAKQVPCSHILWDQQKNTFEQGKMFTNYELMQKSSGWSQLTLL